VGVAAACPTPPLIRGKSTASSVIAITAIADCVAYCRCLGKGTMASILRYECSWDESLLDPRNERALLSAFVAAIAIWAAAFLLTVI
jgi:hypothetical protein